MHRGRLNLIHMTQHVAVELQRGSVRNVLPGWPGCKGLW